MDKIKVSNFRKNNPRATFPNYHSLTSVDAGMIRQRLAARLGFTSNDPKSLTAIIDKKGETYKRINAKDRKFRLSLVLSILDIHPAHTVFVNWYQYDDIDEMEFPELDKYFNYIWYPGSDDIDIFDSSIKWLLSVSHEGNIKFLKIDNVI